MLILIDRSKTHFSFHRDKSFKNSFLIKEFIDILNRRISQKEKEVLILDLFKDSEYKLRFYGKYEEEEINESD